MEIGARIDFMGLISVSMANPNGDPVNGGMPRTDSDGYGIITDVCIKRKLRDRLAQSGVPILITSPRYGNDCVSARLRELQKLSGEELIREACTRWYDVRAFGQIFFGAGKKNTRSACVNGAVSLRQLFSVHPVELFSVPITRCNQGSARGGANDTFVKRSAVRYGLYVLKGSVCTEVARRNGFSEEDALLLKEALRDIFTGDASASRPAGSMVMERLYWWRHNTRLGDVPAARVYDTVQLRLREGCERPLGFSDYIVEEKPLDRLVPEIIC
ncbi:MAG: type I-C CRISPR-associated protein Cas7/Csd2 [Ruminococcaceae bacterium]|nr:type I-C CRISPR-associated protein Cas7/Csd2 [Oscillospiraceae bacterium]